MKSKLLTALLSIMMVGTLLTGCGKSEAPAAEAQPAAVEESVVEETVEETAAEEETVAETAAEETTGSEIVDVTDAVEGAWVDGAGDLYYFNADGTYQGYWVEEDQEVEGEFTVQSDGETTILGIDYEGTSALYYLTVDEENSVLSLENTESGDVVELSPYVEE